MEFARRVVVVTAASMLFLHPQMLGSAQSTRRDLSSRPVKARDAIEELAGSLGRSVACDIDLPAVTVMLGPIAKTPDKALTQLLGYPRFFTVEVSGVVMVAGQSAPARDNYSPERIAACRLAGEDTQATDITFHATPVERILEQLATALGRRAVFEPKAANGQRVYNIELFGVTKTDAIAIVCLATHYQVRSVGDELVFSEYVAKPLPVQQEAPPD